MDIELVKNKAYMIRDSAQVIADKMAQLCGAVPNDSIIWREAKKIEAHVAEIDRALLFVQGSL